MSSHFLESKGLAIPITITRYLYYSDGNKKDKYEAVRLDMEKKNHSKVFGTLGLGVLLFEEFKVKDLAQFEVGAAKMV